MEERSSVNIGKDARSEKSEWRKEYMYFTLLYAICGVLGVSEVFEYMHDYVTISANHQYANCEHNRHFPGCIKTSTAEHQY